MSFHASPDAIAQFGAIIEKQEQHSEAAERYGEQNLDVEGGNQGLIVEVLSSHDDVRSQVIGAMKNLKTVCAQSSIELGRVAGLYRSTDQTEARRLDSTYPGTNAPPMPPMTGPTNLREMIAPAGRLTPPSQPEEFQGFLAGSCG